jgi:hypothetical protein
MKKLTTLLELDHRFAQQASKTQLPASETAGAEPA